MSAPEDKANYVPPPSVGHEIGVMFGFIGVFIVAMVVYGVLFQMYNKRGQKKEIERVRLVRSKEAGYMDEKNQAGNNGVVGT